MIVTQWIIEDQHKLLELFGFGAQLFCSPFKTNFARNLKLSKNWVGATPPSHTPMDCRILMSLDD